VTHSQIDNPSETPRNEVGGQALLEGVMIRSRTGYAVAARRGDGAIVLLQVPYKPLSSGFALLKIPFVRGVMALVEMLAIGTRALQWSAEVFERSLRGANAREVETDLPRKTADAWKRKGFAATAAASLAIAAILVVVLPHFLTLSLGVIPFVHNAAVTYGRSGFNEAEFPILFNLVSGVIRVVIVVGYIVAIGLNRDIRRVFGYHAAEHQAAWAFEKGDEMTVGRVRTFPRLHPRCGTAFLAVVLMLSILVFAAATGVLLATFEGFSQWSWWRRKALILPLQIALLPVVAALAFEALKASARHSEHPLARLVLSPGLFLQRLTTRRADDRQIEVAIVALLAALAIPPDLKETRQYVVQGLHITDHDERVRPWSPHSDKEAQSRGESIHNS